MSQAFSRNLGWLTESELSKLAKLRVGIIGMGGVGGQYAEILTRLGVGSFIICDPDHFSIENTNRQNECKTTNYGKNKAEVIAALIKDINPQAKVEIIAGALTLEQVDHFCDSIDIYLDGLDFFVIDIRIAIFRRMRELQKPSITVAPIGAGSACIVFTKTSMSFDDHFGLHLTEDVTERAQRFLVGLSPSLQQRHYLQEPERTNFAERKVPSLPMGVYAAASIAATTLVKIVLERGAVLESPWVVHYDGYLMKLKKNYILWGYRNPLQRFKIYLMQLILKNQKSPRRAQQSFYNLIPNLPLKTVS